MYESTLERDLACILMIDRSVAKVWEQPEPIRYFAVDGSARVHTFDFLVLGKNGWRVAVAVKPENMVVSSGILETLVCIEQQMPKRFAHAVRLCTREHISRDRAKDARTILRYRSTRNEKDIAAVLDLIGSLGGSIRIDELIDKSGMGAEAFGAVVCLIDDGILHVLGGGRIDLKANVAFAQSSPARAAH